MALLPSRCPRRSYFNPRHRLLFFMTAVDDRNHDRIIFLRLQGGLIVAAHLVIREVRKCFAELPTGRLLALVLTALVFGLIAAFALIIIRTGVAHVLP